MELIGDNHKQDVFDTFFENGNFCIVVVDREGYVTYMNESYCRFLNLDKEEVTGKHVTDVIENTRMHLVAESGKEEMADVQYIKGNYMIANRIPLRSEGEVVGAFGMVLFRDTEEWLQMNSHIRDLLLELKAYRSKRREQTGATYALHHIISRSQEVDVLKDKIKQVAPSDVSVLLRGESGTGKELFAHSIHHLSERSNQPFVKVNCAAIPEDLLESELFGYQEGAFTGAKKGGKPGKFQLADGGTLFLDEIGDMPIHAQVKILRVLQEGEVEAIGATHPQKVDVRIIASTHQPLEQLIKDQRFREDLFYRINVVQFHVPALRERKEDIGVLARSLLQKVTDKVGKRVVDFNADVYEAFKRYAWPGNVRELENAIESAVHLTRSELIGLEDLPAAIRSHTDSQSAVKTLKESLEEAEKQAIKDAIQFAEGDKVKAAEVLGIGKSSLYEKVKKYGL
ncbi:MULTISPECIES: sigma-54 interaction domain-containing protein [Pontibacillus]|uniref:Sigma 54-interacting transcriptional regulator n=1 Tax=Pontibacillus chungwhensis TaxID=265426 RepID=A0ABY8V3I9_9BACI|nr:MULTISPECIES: sigma 54-interacting transcriptional regulator [Pontibacillus]MCD5324529.1 sigma 54-interacting transcriptional regulator [Pontibacillus sp. HN14]WIF99175.1 sigma 54-interacting transcriptional regulator [Pontibacillus chungwhensis]